MDPNEGFATFKWPYDGYSVEVCGSFSDWKDPKKLHKEEGVWTTRVRLPPGTYQYKFIIDGYHWFYDIMKPHVNNNGNVNNYITVEAVEELEISYIDQKGTSEPPKSPQKQPPKKTNLSRTEIGTIDGSH